MDRLKQINPNIQKLINEAIQTEIDLPSGVLVSISQVYTSRDLSSARLYVSVLPYGRSEAMILRLNKLKGLLRKYLADHFPVKKVPELKFFKEEGFERVDRIQHIIDDSKKME